MKKETTEQKRKPGRPFGTTEVDFLDRRICLPCRIKMRIVDRLRDENGKVKSDFVEDLILYALENKPKNEGE